MTQKRTRTRTRTRASRLGSLPRAAAAAALLGLLAVGTQTVGTPAASAHGDGSTVTVYNPITDGDADHNDVSAWWPWGATGAPASHHIVYGSWGYKNDWSIDVFAKAAGRPIVTPFGSRTNTGHPTESKVVGVRAGCASKNPADGGWVVTIEAKDKTTGAVLGRADVMHVNAPRVGVGQVLGAWTTIGTTSQFRYSKCYQVTSTNGIHVHVEFINVDRYACFYTRGYNQGLTEVTSLGVVGSHNYGTQRAQC